MELYITPASIGYLNQLILCLMISGYLMVAQYHHPQPIHRILTYYFGIISGLLLVFFLESSLAPSQRVYTLLFQIPLIALSFNFIFQFVYRFPRLADERRRESRIVLVLTILYTLWEWSYALYRVSELVRVQQFTYRPAGSTYLLMIFCLWLPIATYRQFLTLIPTGMHGIGERLALFTKPPTMDLRATRNNVLIALFVVMNGFFEILRYYYIISEVLSNIILSLSSLLILFLFVINYLNAQPEVTSFMVKLVGLALTSMLSLFGVIGWVVIPLDLASNQIHVRDYYTLRFTPHQQGGYQISEQPFNVIEPFGTQIFLRETSDHECSYSIEFPFQFYVTSYTHIYVCNDGTISMGQPTAYQNYQYHYGSTPIIMALLTNLNADADQGGIFVRQDPDRIVITWYDLPNYHQSTQSFTFQATLYSDGRFDLTYNGIPPVLNYYPNNSPGASVWVIGALPGTPTGDSPQQIDLGSLPTIIGPDGGVHDYLLDYRTQLHHLLMPLVWLILAASVAIVIIFPWIFHRTLVHPLNSLLAGVRRMMAGDYTTNLPIRYDDEIGYLTHSFNQLSATQSRLIETLEVQVQERTAKLDVINAQLRAEISENQRAHVQILQHQRTLAMLEERERLGRDLHDSLGQMFAVINMQVQAAQVLLQRNEVVAANHALEQVGVAARQAHADVRGFILGLRGTPTHNFWMALQQSIEEMRSYGITVHIEEDEAWDAHWLSPINEINLLRIIQEALSNVRQHAHATLVRIKFERQHDRLRLHIHDNGIGLTRPLSSDATQHFGLKTMQERANELRGVLQICSDAHHGTEISLEFPINIYGSSSHVS